MTADGRHVVDRVPGVDGFFEASAVVSAIYPSISPSVGEVLADWIVDCEPAVDLSPLRLTRFRPEMAAEEHLRRACLWRYAHHYSSRKYRRSSCKA